MKKSGQLLDNLKENVTRLQAVASKIKQLRGKHELTEDEQKSLESLYRKEFSLHMDNSRCYDAIIKEVAGEDDFTKKYIKQEAKKYLKVGQIDI